MYIRFAHLYTILIFDCNISLFILLALHYITLFILLEDFPTIPVPVTTFGFIVTFSPSGPTRTDRQDMTKTNTESEPP